MKTSSTFFATAVLLLINFGQLDAGSLTYQCTGASQTFTAPSGSEYMTVTACGASGYGGSAYSYYGRGYCVTDTFPLEAGDIYYVMVGCGGSVNAGGFNGGGAGTGSGGGGGGASDIRTVSSSLSSRLLVGGGGGGLGYSSSGVSYYNGGNGGCINGTSGYAAQKSATGGTQHSGGSGGYYTSAYPSGSAGSLGVGGAGASFTNSGGGGGGWYGGGGGSYGGGGGGSSYGPSSKVCSFNSGVTGYVEINYFQRYTLTYPYTGSTVTFYNPGDVSTVQVQAWGAQGEDSSMGVGGLGGYVNATITNYNFGYLYITVGGSNGYPNGGSRSNPTSCHGGVAAAGGGSTTVVTNGYYTSVVAGGGGGAGYDPACVSNPACTGASIDGGAGGSTAAGSGDMSPAQVGSYGGTGGATTYGVGGYYNASYLYGSSGTSSAGGNAAFETCGGGGGGGSYPGGGGAFTGGGGGTSSTSYPAVLTSRTLGSSRTGNGLVMITFTSAEYGTSSTSSSGSGSSNVGAQVGTAFGWIIFSCCIIGCCCYCCRKKDDNGGGGGGGGGGGVVVTRNPAARQQELKKIDAAVVVMTIFLQSMMGTNDRCSVVSFSNVYTIRANMASEGVAIHALVSCINSVGGGTKLYDAVVASVGQFVATADGKRPWILVILTDGEDTDSGCSRKQAIDIITAFNKPANNFVFVVGLGRTLNDTSLKYICQETKSLYFRAQDLPIMQVVFAMIALQIVEQREVTMARVQSEGGAEAIFARVRERRAVVQIPMDMLILLDVSGSMSDPA